MAGGEPSITLPQMTVILPVHNGERFLAETMESVLAQTYPAQEVIVIDDGSTDGTAAIAEHFSDRIRLETRARAGVSAARNYGLSLAQTDWVAFIDHDDLWAKNHLENLASIIAAHPEADLCYSGARFLICDASTETFELSAPQQYPSGALAPRALLERCVFPPSAVAVRRSKVLAVGGFDPLYTNGEDWDLWLKLVRAGATFLHAPEPTLLYRIHPASAAHNPLPALEQGRAIVERRVLPQLSPWGRATLGRRIISRLESEAAILLRQNGQPGALRLLLRSIARHPFHAAQRYKIAAHMLLYGYRQP